MKLPSSKSLVNRYLILKEAFPDLDLKWQAEAEDVQNLKTALSNYKTHTELYVGEGGTSLRFLAIYLSTQKGRWTLKGEPSLFSRPQDSLCKALLDLGVTDLELKTQTLSFSSQGWKKQNFAIEASKTTQVLTAVALAAVCEKKNFVIDVKGADTKSGYFELTYKFLKDLGALIDWDGKTVKISPSHLKTSVGDEVEGDWSTAAFLYVLKALKGEIEIENLFLKSPQPDSRILELLKKAGVFVQGKKVSLKNSKGYTSLKEDLGVSPDLFPVLAVFSCFCKGTSNFFGAKELKYKESNRILKIKELLELCGYQVKENHDGLEVKGEGLKVLDHSSFEFDVSKDHRLAMSCHILKEMGYKIKAEGMESMRKSYPEFFTGEKS